MKENEKLFTTLNLTKWFSAGKTKTKFALYHHFVSDEKAHDKRGVAAHCRKLN